MTNISVVIPNWNGKKTIGKCLDSLLSQSIACRITVVENGSIDGSLEFLMERYPSVELVVEKKNLGFAGGVNAGIRQAMVNKSDFVALFNNDALADKDWLRNLAKVMEQNNKVGIVTCKLMDIHAKHLDSTGDLYTTWGLPYPRGRGEPVSDKYDDQTDIFGASGGASLYRVSMLEKIGLMDEDFFAYYEDVDISFRAQLAGWKVAYAPFAVAYHQIGATSGKIKGFTTTQTLKNLPWLLWKNIPGPLLPTVVPRFTLAYTGFFISALQRGQVGAAFKGVAMSTLLLPKKIWQRQRIQNSGTVSLDYIKSMLVYDLPPNAHKLRKLRSTWWKLTRHKTYDSF
jgi:GT2 family glycosyltransferase